MKRFKGSRKVPEESTKDRYDNLRGEFQRLRKEVQRLRKENERLRGRDEQISEFFQEAVESETHERIETRTCPKCASSNINIVDKLRGNVDYYFCNNPSCYSRGPIK